MTLSAGTIGSLFANDVNDRIEEVIKVDDSDAARVREELGHYVVTSSIKKQQTAGDNVRFAADRGKNGHADAFWAHALCKHAAKAPGGPLVFERVGLQAPPGAQPYGCYGDDTPARKWGSL